jgi:hypothetical protein
MKFWALMGCPPVLGVLGVVGMLGILGIVGGVGIVGEANAEPYSVESRIEPFTLEDQHGESQQVDATTRIILFSRDMDGGKLLKEALADVSEDILTNHSGVYVADISGMPSLVARMFALPSMRKRPYAILLDRDGQTTRRLPDVDERATLIFLEKLEITKVTHAETAQAVREALGLEPVAAQD